MKARVVKKEWNEVTSENFDINDEQGRVSIFASLQRMNNTNLIIIDKSKVSELIKALQKYQEVSK